jgi:hypothetical protein
MKVRLLIPAGWKQRHSSWPDGLCEPHIFPWPADREIPEGYEELEIVPPASRWNRAVCIHCGCSEPIHTEDCVNRPAVTDPVSIIQTGTKPRRNLSVLPGLRRRTQDTSDRERGRNARE